MQIPNCHSSKNREKTPAESPPQNFFFFLDEAAKPQDPVTQSTYLAAGCGVVATFLSSSSSSATFLPLPAAAAGDGGGTSSEKPRFALLAGSRSRVVVATGTRRSGDSDPGRPRRSSVPFRSSAEPAVAAAAVAAGGERPM
jgi:hypothetical protein